MVFAIAGEPVMLRPQIRLDGKRWIECEHAGGMSGRGRVIVLHREAGGKKRMMELIGMADPAERLDRLAVATRQPSICSSACIMARSRRIPWS
jgi:hypothetical protein